MTSLLEHLSRDTLPKPLIEQFMNWCIWQQAHPALLTILEKAQILELAAQIRQTNTLSDLTQLTQQANAYSKKMRGTTGPLGLSAAEAATFEFSNMLRAAREETLDVEGVAFFASRVAGWAGWARTDFRSPAEKSGAEQRARHEQESILERLWRQNSV